MNSYIAHIFEELAAATWDRIQFGEQLRCSQGEETITDINLLELKRARLPNIRVDKFNKAQESETGLDWEWWIGSAHNGWWRYAVQAKKVDSSGRYSSIRHKIDHQFQIDILEQYATLNRCIPVYCLYNYASIDLYPYWHCNYPYNQYQLGCTVASIDVVRKAFAERGHKTFQFIHSHQSVLPWRCLVKCPAIFSLTSGHSHPLAGHRYQHIRPYQYLPSILRGIHEDPHQDVNINDSLDLPDDYYSQQIRVNNMQVYPKRVLVVDVG